ncbi:MAG: S1 RNA-binding domain-containing protein [Minisyncoccia bacterium]
MAEKTTFSLNRFHRFNDILENNSLKAKVLEKNRRYLLVDLSPYGTGIIRGPQLKEAKELIKNIEIGEEILVKVLARENELGLIEIALAQTILSQSWERLRKIKEENQTVSLLISEANAGGLMGKLEGVIGFLPVSQLSLEHYPLVENADKEKILQKLKSFVGQELKVKILDLDPNTSKLIFSEKLIEQEKVGEFLKNYKVGDIVEVKITKIVDFGAFATLINTPFPIDALIHISEIPIKKEGVNKETSEVKEKEIKDEEAIKDVIKEGEVVKAKITSIKNNRLTLSLKF